MAALPEYTQIRTDSSCVQERRCFRDLEQIQHLEELDERVSKKCMVSRSLMKSKRNVWFRAVESLNVTYPSCSPLNLTSPKISTLPLCKIVVVAKFLRSESEFVTLNRQLGGG